MKILILVSLLTLLFVSLQCQPLLKDANESFLIALGKSTAPVDTLTANPAPLSYDDSFKLGNRYAEYLTHHTANVGYGFMCGITLGFVGLVINRALIKPTRPKYTPAGVDSTAFADGFRKNSLKLNKRAGLAGSLFGTAAQTVIIVSLIDKAMHSATWNK